MEFIEGVNIERLPKAKVLVRVGRSIFSASAPSFHLLLSARIQLELFEHESSSHHEEFHKRSPLNESCEHAAHPIRARTEPSN